MSNSRRIEEKTRQAAACNRAAGSKWILAAAVGKVKFVAVSGEAW